MVTTTEYTPLDPNTTAFVLWQTYAFIGFFFNTEGVAFNQTGYLFNHEQTQDFDRIYTPVLPPETMYTSIEG